MLAWMSDAINKEADAAQPFQLNAVRLCDKRQDLNDISGPKASTRTHAQNISTAALFFSSPFSKTLYILFRIKKNEP
jgi:hypothetical protein